MSDFYIGLMSGTSVDGIDAGLVDFSPEKPELIAFEYQPFSAEIKEKIQRLSSDQPLFLKEYGALDCQLGHLFADSVNQLLNKATLSASEITAIGSHGQTLYHAPDSLLPFSLQIGDPNIIVEKTGITTVADFRRRDIAAHGQGAPLTPTFHQAMFQQPDRNICVVNIGGIANITALSNKKTIAFDTGTGNTLMDYWCQKHLKQNYDKNGHWANSGAIIPELLKAFKDADYFKLPPPKSTGKEYFSANWLEKHLGINTNYKVEDVQATLCQLTADTIIEAVREYAKDTEELLICGGGAHNKHLFSLLEKQGYQVNSTEKYGIHPDHVEAMAFAWLARQTMNNLSGNLIEVTGANSPVILGGIYPKIN
ncbi:MAG: anhydro-N-acetylmuramic acid kinase [Methylococcaceae bacterium]|nr:anhydro-N-acetylmuramic acid kinase [Methylococcaceae bacterium]